MVTLWLCFKYPAQGLESKKVPLNRTVSNYDYFFPLYISTLTL